MITEIKPNQKYYITPKNAEGLLGLMSWNKEILIREVYSDGRICFDFAKLFYGMGVCTKEDISETPQKFSQ